MLDLFLSDMFGIVFILLLTGIFAGFVAGLLGVGGGIIMVPLVAYILTQTQTGVLTAMHSAIGTSLAVIIPTSFLSAKTNSRLGAFSSSSGDTSNPLVLNGFLSAFSAESLASKVGSSLKSLYSVPLTPNAL